MKTAVTPKAMRSRLQLFLSSLISHPSSLIPHPSLSVPAGDRPDADVDLRAGRRRLAPVEADERLGVVQREAVVGDDPAGAVAGAGDAAGARLVDGAAAVEDERRRPRLLHRLAVHQHSLPHEVLVGALEPALAVLPEDR